MTTRLRTSIPLGSRVRTRALRRIFAVAALLALVASPAAGQSPDKPVPSPGPPLKVRTDVVNVYGVVRDKKGRLIPNLNREDFEMREDKAVQEIRYFSRQSDTPLTLGFLIDTGPSQRDVLPDEQEQAKLFIRQVLRANDLGFVLHFDQDVDLLHNLTGDTERLARAIDATQINGPEAVSEAFSLPGDFRLPIPFPLPGTIPAPEPLDSAGSNRLLDAVYLAANDVLKHEAGRKVIVLLSDGVDQGSRATFSRALEAAQNSDVVIYAVHVRGRHRDRCLGELYGGHSVMKKLAEETGGRLIVLDRKKDMAAAFRDIAEELRTQYLLGYTPTFRGGAYRKIELRVRNGGYKVQARRGYYAPMR